VATGGSASPATPAAARGDRRGDGRRGPAALRRRDDPREVTAGSGGGAITITGDDLTAVMDRVDFSGMPYPAMPVIARVALVVAKYAMFGIAPLPIPPIAPDIPLPIDRIPAHRGTDLRYLRDLAEQCGHVFFIEPARWSAPTSPTGGRS
jgi:hypothetical protein